MARAALLAGTALAVLVAAVATHAASAPVPGAVASCRNHVEAGYAPLPAPGALDLRLDRLAYTGLARGATFRGRPDYEIEGRMFFFVKSAPMLFAGGPVTVSVAPRLRGVVAIGVGGIRGFHDTIRYRPCAPGHAAFSYDGTIGRWTGWSGAFVATRRVCAELQIWDGDGVRYRHVALGKPCR